MAFQISKSSPVGIPAVYWVVVAARYDLRTGTCGVDLAGYVSQAGYQAGDQPVAGTTELLTVAQAGDVTSALEAALQGLPDWAGAVKA